MLERVDWQRSSLVDPMSGKSGSKELNVQTPVLRPEPMLVIATNASELLVLLVCNKLTCFVLTFRHAL